jgi:hypothetical protein
MPHDPSDRAARPPDLPAELTRATFEELQPPTQRHPLDGRRREWMLVDRHEPPEAPSSSG